MKKFTEKVHHEELNEIVWVKRETAKQEQRKPAAEVAVKVPIVYSNQYGVNFGGLEKLHPFDAAKGHNIQKFLRKDLPLTDGQFYEPQEITREELLKVHTRKYLRSLNWSCNAAKISEIILLIFVPNYYVQRAYLRPMRFQTAGSIFAGMLALNTGWSINLGGGFHHCCSYEGGGFCAYADITLLIRKVLEQQVYDVQTIMIVDLDAHQGNGHERDFKENNSVYILDIYNAYIYPRDHPAKLSIRCAVELKPRTEDALYLYKLKKCLGRALDEFRPDFVVYNAGTDILKGDPLGMLSITPEGVIERDRIVFSTFRQRRIPIVMLLSGGYLKSSARVIADSIINLRREGLCAF